MSSAFSYQLNVLFASFGWPVWTQYSTRIEKGGCFIIISRNVFGIVIPVMNSCMLDIARDGCVRRMEEKGLKLTRKKMSTTLLQSMGNGRFENK